MDYKQQEQHKKLDLGKEKSMMNTQTINSKNSTKSWTWKKKV